MTTSSGPREAIRDPRAVSRRTPNERLALFLKRADRLTRARAIKMLFRVAVELQDDGERNLDVRIEEPDEDALLALVADVRRFDNPKAALYVPAIIDILRVDADERGSTSRAGKSTTGNRASSRACRSARARRCPSLGRTGPEQLDTDTLDRARAHVSYLLRLGSGPN